MKRLLRKTFVVIALFALLFVSTDCKKQKRCGCGKDILVEFTDYPCNVFFGEDPDNPSIYMRRVGYPYYTYTFCNPDEIRPLLEGFKYGDELVVSGNVYWDCNYVMQASNDPYSSFYQYYNIYVTDIYMDMYGKDNSNEELKKGF